MPTDREISTFLSHVLRHAPQEIGLTLDRGGWARIEDLLHRATLALSHQDLLRIVANSDKQRFALSPDGSRIRANQGHSIAVDLDLTPQTPPATLFHGTAAQALPAIKAEGLRAMSRHHVHLSVDPQTARQVGQRHGTPVVLTVDAATMAQEGARFYISANGVWLTDHVPPARLSGL